jgi:acyl-CoA thioester hydrolase
MAPNRADDPHHGSPAEGERPFVHEHSLKVRYAETDQMGRVHHSNYLVYVEEARTALLAELGLPYREVERAGLGLVVRDVQIRYRAAALYEDDLLVRTRVSDLRAASVELTYEIWRPADQVHVASLSTRLACVDLRADPPEVRTLSDALRAAFGRARGG